MNEVPKKIPYDIAERLKTGLKYHKAGQLSKAEAVYLEILETDPNQPDALHLSGVVSHQLGKTDNAISLIRRALKIDPNQPFFYNNLGTVFSTKGEIVQAANCYKRAIQLNPNYAEAHANLGDVLQVKTEFEGAIDEYKKALMIKPGLTEAAIKLGYLNQEEGKFADALYWYHYVSKIIPENPEAYYYIGAIYLDQKDYDNAISYFKKVLSIDPTHVEAYFKMGIIKKKKREWECAISCFQKALLIKPDFAEIYCNMGLVYKEQKKLYDAVLCYRKALELNPEFPEAHNNLGTAFQELGKPIEAISSFLKALEIKRNYVEPLHNLGNAYQDLGKIDKSIECYKKAIKIRPDFVQAYYHMGLAFQSRGKAEKAISCFQKALEIDPTLFKAYCHLFHQLQQTCDWEKLGELGDKIDGFTNSALKYGKKTVEMPFLNIARHADPSSNFNVARALSQHLLRSVSEMNLNFLIPKRRSTKAKITIGYLSNNFRNHPTAHQMLGLFGSHSRKEFETYCYSYGEDDASVYRDKIKRDCDKFFDIRHLSYTDAAKKIFQDQVDILVDLVGFTRGSRMKICALRPAPVQIRYLGMAGTTGADFFDYIITDEVVTPECDAPFYTEKFVYMPNCYQINYDNQLISTKKWTRKHSGLPEKAFIFCSFNTNYKIDRVMFRVWMNILKRTSRSVLWMLSESKTAEKNLKYEAKKCDVDPSRIVFAHKLNKEDHLARLKLADLALDSRIVNGAATTSDLLRAGVPLLTLKGAHFASRMSASILTAIGLPELITNDIEAYENVAVRLARSHELKVIREKLAKNRTTGPLFDTSRFVRGLESAYKEIWDIYTKGHNPRQIEVIESFA